MVAGLTLAASSAFSHDFYVNVFRRGVAHAEVSEREQVLVARITAGVVGLIAIWLASKTGATTNAAALVAGLAFVIASAANLPVLLFTLFWKRFNTFGAVAGLLGGTIMSSGCTRSGHGVAGPRGRPPPVSLALP